MEKGMKKLLIISILMSLIFSSMPAFAMETQAPIAKRPVTFLDVLPAEIREEILKYLATEGNIVENLKKFYASSPYAQTNLMLTEAILKYLVEKNEVNQTDLMFIASGLAQYPVFQNKELLKWIENERERLSLETKLFLAVYYLNVEDVKKLISQGVNVNAVGKYYPALTPLSSVLTRIFPAEKINEIALLLLQAGADPNLPRINVQNQNVSLLRYAREALGNQYLVELLMKYGARE
jgi:hypothetical protein